MGKIYENMKYDVSPKAGLALLGTGIRDLIFDGSHESFMGFKRILDSTQDIKYSIDLKTRTCVVKKINESISPDKKDPNQIKRERLQSMRELLIQAAELGVNRESAEKTFELMGKYSRFFIDSVVNDGFANALTPGIVTAAYHYGRTATPEEPVLGAAYYASYLMETQPRKPCKFDSLHIEFDSYDQDKSEEREFVDPEVTENLVKRIMHESRGLDVDKF